MNTSFVPQITPPETLEEPAYWFIFSGSKLLVHQKSDTVQVPRLWDLSELGVTAVRQQYLGYLEGSKPIHCYTVGVPEKSEAPAGMAFMGLRQLFGLLDETCIYLAGRAFQIIDWDRTSQYCGQCGAPNTQLTHERAKKCLHCGHIKYPRISPAIIVRVARHDADGDRILLANGRRFRSSKTYSVLAGFVEPGETLEECVRREICEEVGITVKNIRYFGSQPWPFPDSLMIAFTADYDSGEITLEETEIVDANWFRPGELPDVPPPISIARRLIDNFVAQTEQQK
ncbi:MAG: NAD(+) diphosphatase [Ardenticatenaceae bacterium]|nr:NAD(+) diphosphatase [Ardenticatenaceae bacterium]MCB9445557.1 NAD(+) diphosphatase [Ardenticatenaceae bacterium]